MRMYDIILKKRGGAALTKEEISFLVQGYTNDRIPDYQISAWLMAVYFQGMTEQEIVALTECMAQSGDTVDLSRFGTLSVDKHSTGGVGDKTTLIIAPIVAALGAKVTKLSGRGLGHTGGTVDKLESIPGYRTAIQQTEFLELVERVGMAVVGQSGDLAPADKKLYALRDVTATVDSIPLITASIMSKKLAAGSHNIVLDVKVGSGAFMKTSKEAETLAEQMVKIGKSCGKNMAALITDMDTPLGRCVGNAMEIKEAVAVLTGQFQGDLYEVCVALATQMTALAFSVTEETANRMVLEILQSGAAFEKMQEWVSAQGGDAEYLRNVSKFPESQYKYDVISDSSGYIASMDAEVIGSVGVILGAGRATKEDSIDHAAGIYLSKKTGEYVSKGEAICTLYTNNKAVLSVAAERYKKCLMFSADAPTPKPLIYNIIK